MSTFGQLINNPPTLTVVKNANDVIINMVSCMCDNRHLLRLKKNSDGEFKLHTGSSAFSNFQMKCREYEIEWAADSSDWKKVFSLINTGTSRVESVVSRKIKATK